MQENTQFGDELITDPEAQRLLRVGSTKFFELQKSPDFPPPIWLGPRLKRHRRAALLKWALSHSTKPEVA
jgi:predicted DNA-binding transcriptional regulator AlpA